MLISAAALLVCEDDEDSVLVALLIMMIQNRLLQARTLTHRIVPLRQRTIDSFSEQDCWEYFRFRKGEIIRLHHLRALRDLKAVGALGSIETWGSDPSGS